MDYAKKDANANIEETKEVMSELVSNPSPLTMEIVKIVQKIDEKHRNNLNKSGFFAKIGNQLKLKLYTEQGYREYYNFLRDYEVQQPAEKNSAKRLYSLFAEFEKVYEKIIWNNLALAYLHLKEKGKKGDNASEGNEDNEKSRINSSLLTMEDKKMIGLADIYRQKEQKERMLAADRFKKEFGHYCLNPYELSSRRFSEYSEEELVKIGKLAALLNISKSKELADAIENNSSGAGKESILICLRELGKHRALQIVDRIRTELLRIQKEELIPDIFSMSFKELEEELNI